MRTAAVLAIPLVLLLAGQPSEARHQAEYFFDVRPNFSYERVIAPASVHITGMNPFRANFSVTATAQQIPPTDVLSVFNQTLLNLKPAASTTQAFNRQSDERPIQVASLSSTRFLQSRAATAPPRPARTIAAVPRPSPTNTPGRYKDCDLNKAERITKPNFGDCIIAIGDQAELLRQQLVFTRRGIAYLTERADTILAREPSIDSRERFNSYAKMVQSCFFTNLVKESGVPKRNDGSQIDHCSAPIGWNGNDIAEKVTRPFPDDSIDEGQIRSECAKASLKCIRDLIDAADSTRGTYAEYLNRLTIMSTNFTNETQKRQLAILADNQTMLNRLVDALKAYDDLVLGPVIAAGEASDSEKQPAEMLMPARFEARVAASCNGLANGGQSVTYRFNLNNGPQNQAGSGAPLPTTKGPTASTSQPNRTSTNQSDSTQSGGTSDASNAAADKSLTQSYDVTLVCQNPVFVSIGLGGNSLSGATFTTVAANRAGFAPQAPGATPVPSTIAATNTNSHPSLLTLASFPLQGYDPQGGGLALSAGLGSNAPFGGAGRLEAITGLSYAFSRSLLVTAGASYGSTTQLAPGYRTGGFIAPGAMAPTTTSNRVGGFAGLTFVVSKSPSSATPAPSASPKAQNPTNTQPKK
jgi:hypothetical protein